MATPFETQLYSHRSVTVGRGQVHAGVNQRYYRVALDLTGRNRDLTEVHTGLYVTAPVAEMFLFDVPRRLLSLRRFNA